MNNSYILGLIKLVEDRLENSVSTAYIPYLHWLHAILVASLRCKSQSTKAITVITIATLLDATLGESESEAITIIEAHRPILLALHEAVTDGD